MPKIHHQLAQESGVSAPEGKAWAALSTSAEDKIQQLAQGNLEKAPSAMLTHRAHEAFKAMHGSLLGYGADKERLWRALRGITPHDTTEYVAIYRDMHTIEPTSQSKGRTFDIVKDLRDKLSGAEETRALAYLNGETARGDAVGARLLLAKGVRGVQDLISQLEKMSPEERQAMNGEYQKLRGCSVVSELPRETSSEGRNRIIALMEGRDSDAHLLAAKSKLQEPGGRKAAELHLQEASEISRDKGEAADIRPRFKEVTGSSFEKVTDSRLGNYEQRYAAALASGDLLEAKALSVGRELSRRRPHVEVLRNALENASEEERSALQHKIPSLRAQIEENVRGSSREMLLTLLDKGHLNEQETIFYELRERHPQMAKIKAVLEQKSVAEIQSLDALYREADPQGLAAAGVKYLSGRSRQEFLQLLEGKPASSSQRIEQLHRTAGFERSGVGSALTRAFAPEGKLLRSGLATSQRLMSDALEDGIVTPKEEVQLTKEANYLAEHTSGFREKKDKVAEALADAVAVSVGTAAGPLVGVPAGGIIHPVMMKLGKGAAYDRQEVIDNAKRGAVLGGVSGAAASISHAATESMHVGKGPTGYGIRMGVRSAFTKAPSR